ncbi:MAG: ATP-binding protein [Elusimicrobiota bacterium]
MTNKKRSSLKTKLVFFASLLVVLVTSSLSYYVRTGQRRAIVEGLESSHRETVKALRLVAREAILMDDDTYMINYLNLLRKSLNISYAMVVNEDGSIRVHNDANLIGQTLKDSESEKTFTNKEREQILTQNFKTTDGHNIIDMSIPIYVGFDSTYKGVARIGFDKSVIDQEINTSLQQTDKRLLKAFGLAFFIGIIGAFLLASFITRPIEILKEGAQKIGEGKLDHRIQVSTGDELQELADDFNLMAHKLSELDEMKRDFVSNVTHELRSPMTSIRGYMDLLLQGAGGALTDLQKDYLSVIKNSSVRLSRFIDNLLDVAKIEAHKLVLTPELQNLFDLGHEMQVLFKPQLDEKKITFENNIPREGIISYTDKEKMAEVLINLTSNAIKFSPEGGKIQLICTLSDHFIELILEDTGVGIPPDMINKLFNKFEQVKSNQGYARKHKGTGLGLTITKGIVEAHGGKIWIKSPASWGKGTAFHFTVPRYTDKIKQ